MYGSLLKLIKQHGGKMTKYYQIRYEGEFSDLEARTLLSSLLSMVESLQEISKVHNEVLHHDYRLDVNITPFQKGSFIVSFSLHAKELIETLFHMLSNKEAIAYIAALIGSLTGTIQLIKWLKGDKPSKIEINNNNGNITIINIDGDKRDISNVDYKVLQSTKIHNHVNNCFKMINCNESINSVKIIEQDGNLLKELVVIDRPEFDLLSQTSNVIDLPTSFHETMLPNVSITIVKLSFERNYKWSFYYNGFKINASIKDLSFFDQIDNGIHFAKGDKLIVDLRIVQEYDKEVRSLVNKEYIIDRVVNHIPVFDEQIELPM
jgi:hypothetical protein